MSALLGSILRFLQQLLCSQQGVQQGQQDGEHNQQFPPAGASDPQQEAAKRPVNHSHSPHQEDNRHPHVPHTPEHKPHQVDKPHSPTHYSTQHRPYHPRINENLVNQNNEHYKQLRERAHEEGNAMAKCFDESHRAYEAGDGARAKELSNEGHAHQREMDRLNSQASDWIYQANNTDSQPGEIDLHGLFVKEAITHTERAIQEAQSRGDSEIHLIVGKGLHSPDHIAKLEPAIENLMQKYNLAAHLDEHNSGVLVVALDGRRNNRSLELHDITRRLERRDEDCVIM